MNTIFQRTITALALFAAVLLAAGNTSAETTITYLINDGLGSPIAAMDQQGAVIWRKDYQPYGGEYTLDPAATEERIGFTGHVHDTGTGLTYMGARYYDPVAGRFMSADPVGFDESNPMSFSRYAYANSNPYGFVDPDGGTPVDSLVVLLYPAGKAFGGLAAYAQGVITGDQALVNNVNAGLANDRSENVGALGLAAAVFFLPPGAGSLEKGGAVAKKGLGGNPFKGKSPQQIDNVFRKKGFDVKGTDAVAGKGSYINPKTGRKYYIDKGGKYKKGTELPHVDVHRPSSSSLPKKKFPLADRLIE